MAGTMQKSLWLLPALVLVVWAQSDTTRQAGARGPQVVESTLDLVAGKCVFSDDKLFFRRVAFVESNDGADSDTYKSGYDGGIWKVKIDLRYCH